MRHGIEPLKEASMPQDPKTSEPGLVPRIPDQPLGPPDRSKWWARAFGGLFLAGSAVHIILVRGWPNAYDSFADASYWPFIEHTWRSVLVPNVHVLIPVLAAFEASVGVLILVGRTRRIGIVCAIGFSVALMLFGWGFWVWSLPVVGLLAYFWHLEASAKARADRWGSVTPTGAAGPDCP